MAIENKNGKVDWNKGWEMVHPFTIGYDCIMPGKTLLIIVICIIGALTKMLNEAFNNVSIKGRITK